MENYVMHVRTVDKSWTPQAPPTTSVNLSGPGRKQGVLYKQRFVLHLILRLLGGNHLKNNSCRDVFKGWRPRVFVLDEQMAALHYYLQEDEVQSGQPRKSILLSGCTITGNIAAFIIHMID